MTRRRVRFTATARSTFGSSNSGGRKIQFGLRSSTTTLEEALKMLSALPGIGSPYPSAPMMGVRRFYLERLMSHLYFTFDERELVIRALWHVPCLVRAAAASLSLGGLQNRVAKEPKRPKKSP